MRPIGHLPKRSVVQTTATSVQFSVNESSLLSMPLYHVGWKSILQFTKRTGRVRPLAC